MQQFRFLMMAAGCDEEVTITFRFGGWDRGDVKEFFEASLAEFCDGKARLLPEPKLSREEQKQFSADHERKAPNA